MLVGANVATQEVAGCCFGKKQKVVLNTQTGVLADTSPSIFITI